MQAYRVATEAVQFNAVSKAEVAQSNAANLSITGARSSEAEVKNPLLLCRGATAEVAQYNAASKAEVAQSNAANQAKAGAQSRAAAAVVAGRAETAVAAVVHHEEDKFREANQTFMCGVYQTIILPL